MSQRNFYSVFIAIVPKLYLTSILIFNFYTIVELVELNISVEQIA